MAVILALTGGLDSAWCLKRMIEVGNDCEPAVFAMGNGGAAVIAEFLLSREIVRRFCPKRNDGITHHTLGMNALGGYIIINKDTPSGRLLQQGRVVQGLARLVTEQRSRDPIHCAVGWHKNDAVENSSEWGDWSLEDYDKLKTMFELLCHFGDTGRRIIPLQMPAWDQSKRDMWWALPEEIRPLVTIHAATSLRFAYSPSRQQLMMYTDPGSKSGKGDEYLKLGIDYTAAWIFAVDENLIRELRAPIIEQDYRYDAIIAVLRDNENKYLHHEKIYPEDRLTIVRWFTHTRWSEEGERIISSFKENTQQGTEVDLADAQKAEGTTSAGA